MDVMDASLNLAPHITELKNLGIKAIGRYYSTHLWKVMTKKEALLLDAAGFKLFTVFEDGNTPSEFTPDTGTFAAQFAIKSAEAIGQPKGSAIYFAADFDADAEVAEKVLAPYFAAILEVFTAKEHPYRIGVYGDGTTCQLMLDKKYCELFWLSAAKKHSGTLEFYASGKWSLSQHPEQSFGSFDADYDEAKTDFGQFQLTGGQALSTDLIAPINPGPASDNSSFPWMQWMEEHIGEVQRTGAVPTAFTRDIFSHTSYPLKDITPESCAATVCAALEENGFKSTHSAAAESYKTYGEECDLKPGCIVVYTWDNGSHHVDFCDAETNATLVRGLGGNQGGELKYSFYLRKYISATRWPVKA